MKHNSPLPLVVLLILLLPLIINALSPALISLDDEAKVFASKLCTQLARSSDCYSSIDLIGKTNERRRVSVDTKNAKIQYDKESFVSKESPFYERFVLYKEP